jgi:type 2 lantibiotic biosynthesis protein LanM
LDGFLGLVGDRIANARAQLRCGLEEDARRSSRLHFDVDAIGDALWAPMPWRLVRLCSRTLVLELHVADLRGRLGSGTPEERYEAYLGLLTDPEVAAALFDEYPVLDQMIDRTLINWVRSSQGFVADGCADAELLQHTFADPLRTSGQELTRLVGVEPGMGDLHRGGRSVVFATFGGESGEPVKLVYKPRSLAADVHVNQLLAWIDERGDHPPFRQVRVLDRGDHGWVEWIGTARDGSTEEAARYYRRVGGLLALAYALNTIDLHHENIVVAGDQPVLVDLETMFHPVLADIDTARADEHALLVLATSVMGPGLLPQRILGDGVDAGMDVSGIGAAGPQETPFEVPSWSGTATSDMRMTRVRGTYLGGHNRPVADGTPTDPLQFVDDLVGGFESIYRVLMRHRDELLAAGGPIAAFADDPIRILVRPTRSYARLLDESSHPDVLRDRADRQELFESLRVAIPLSPVLARTIGAEHHDLWEGDIPIFTTTPSSRDLVTSTGDVLADVLDEPGATAVERRIRGLDEDDLARQRWLIQASLSTAAPAASDRPPAPAGARATPVTRPVAAVGLVDIAHTIGERLEATAICGAIDATWLGLTTYGDDGGGCLGPAGVDLYDGLSGIALFLAHLGNLTGDAEMTALARRAVRAVRRSELDRPTVGLGAFTGAGGLIYTYTHLGVLWGDTDLIDAAHKVCTSVPDALPADRLFDLTSGAAGAIVAMASLWHAAPRPSLPGIVGQCADHLLAASSFGPDGRTWPSPTPRGLPLSGLSHGAAGFAVALQVAADITGAPAARAGAAEAVRFERSLFVPAEGNWEDRRFPDREDGGDRPHPVTWCHGAPGIGLARLRTASTAHPSDRESETEVHTAVGTTLLHGFDGSHCLCHGALGNLELLLQASRSGAAAGRAARYRQDLATWTAVVVEDVRRNGPRCANGLGIETPGLMTGLAGIGLQLLRLAEPDVVPSVLTLEVPVGRGGIR